MLGLWKGCGPNILRAMLTTGSQIATFEELKEQINKARGTPSNDIFTRLIACVGSGVIMSVVALPADNLKTKLQKMKKNKDGVYPYTGLVDCFKKSVAREGAMGLWVGLPTFILRIAPHSVVTLMMLDYLYQLSPMKK